MPNPFDIASPDTLALFPNAFGRGDAQPSGPPTIPGLGPVPADIGQRLANMPDPNAPTPTPAGPGIPTFPGLGPLPPDLAQRFAPAPPPDIAPPAPPPAVPAPKPAVPQRTMTALQAANAYAAEATGQRSEERRGGKEC